MDVSSREGLANGPLAGVQSRNTTPAPLRNAPRSPAVATNIAAGYTNSMKTAISIPDALFQRADAAAEDLHVSRSELYRRALTAYLRDLPAKTVTERLDEFYGANSGLGGLEPGWDEAQAEIAARDPW